jgi:hypothetical protein
MKRPKSDVPPPERTVAVIQLGWARDQGKAVLFTAVATPGSDEGAVRFWELDGYLPTAAQVTDLLAYLQKEVNTAIVSFIGVQEVLGR